MYFEKTTANCDSITFSNPTRGQLDLASKESVER
jgi:hypothetical protein